METPPVLFGIDADREPRRQLAMLVDDRVLHPRALSDLHVGEAHRILDGAITVQTHVGREERASHRRAAHDAAAGYDRVDRHAATVLVVEDELGGWELSLRRPHGPRGIVEVQLRDDFGEVDVRFPVGIEGPHVAPIRLAVRHVDAALAEMVHEDVRAIVHQTRDHVLAEVVGRVGDVGIDQELLVEEGGVEDVDPHARERTVRPPRERERHVGLFLEGGNAVLRVDAHHAEIPRLLGGHLDARDGNFCRPHEVILDHAAIVHFVDVVASEHQNQLRILAPNDIEVLVNRVRRALVPVVRDPLLRRKHLDELVEARAVEEAPATLDMANEAMRLVLGADIDPANARIDAVGEREIDDAELARERDRGLRAPVGELLQARAAPPGEYHGDGAAGGQSGEPLVDAAAERPLLVLDPLLDDVHSCSLPLDRTSMKRTTDTLLEQLLEARLHDPFRYFGAHRQCAGWVVRTFNPNAARAWIETPAGWIAPSTADRGLFEFRSPEAPPRPWRIRFDEDSRARESFDAYAFSPQISEHDLFLFNAGRLHEAWRTLGAIPMERETVPGTRFAVWAPNAERVSVVGDFNRWDGRRHPMASRGASGVWERFIPGAPPGALD